MKHRRRVVFNFWAAARQQRAPDASAFMHIVLLASVASLDGQTKPVPSNVDGPRADSTLPGLTLPFRESRRTWMPLDIL